MGSISKYLPLNLERMVNSCQHRQAPVNRIILIIRNYKICLHCNVVDPWHFGTDPDPQIRTFDLKSSQGFSYFLCSMIEGSEPYK